MARIKDVSIGQMPPWDQYTGKNSEEAISSIYNRIGAISSDIRTWYWRSIGKKRTTSLILRFIAFVFLLIGTALPIIKPGQYEIKVLDAATKSELNRRLIQLKSGEIIKDTIEV